MRKSFLLAGGLFLLVVLWLVSGQFGDHDFVDSSVDILGGTAVDEIMTVRGRTITRQPYVSEVVISGRTEAVRSVAIKSQTDGRVDAVLVEKGEFVRKGDVICQLATDDREASLAEARALEAQRELEYRAAQELLDKGHRSKTQAAAARAQLDAARALVARREVELSYAALRAPFDGIIDDRPAEVGDYLQKGHVCAEIIDTDPYLVVGEVSERQVGKIRIGSEGTARLVDGTQVNGWVRYIAQSARADTRTFRIELEVPNPDGTLRDGVTAEIRIPVEKTQAFLLSRASLVLSDDGEVGVRVVENGRVRFYPVHILGDSNNGIWVDGVPEDATLITVGQEFVSEGQAVRVDLEG
ncbi:MAG: efflux RND transporter periplasmic adaptor subunit [Alphaproteobacteria bacterium]|nr:MAG: efflux RND transporter periplasmic adaptor subunit [Alphaproteobacteria bacterium]